MLKFIVMKSRPPKKPDADLEPGGEVVDGPAAAAKILNSMSAANRERILKEISTLDPALAGRIESNLSTFDDLLELTPQSIQRLIQEVDQSDLVVSMKIASDEIKNCLYTNMSERKREQVKDDFDNLPPVRIAQVEDAQHRILAKLEELREKGLIRSQSKKDIYV